MNFLRMFGYLTVLYTSWAVPLGAASGWLAASVVLAFAVSSTVVAVAQEPEFHLEEAEMAMRLLNSFFVAYLALVGAGYFLAESVKLRRLP